MATPALIIVFAALDALLLAQGLLAARHCHRHDHH
jgi:hypothetical protein